MQLEVMLELEIKLDENQFNINGIIKAICMSQNEYGRALLQEVAETMDRKACNTLITSDTMRYCNKGYSKREFKTPMGITTIHFT